MESAEAAQARGAIEKGKNQIEPLTVAAPWPAGYVPQPGLPAWATVSPATAAASEWHGGWWRQGRPTRRCSARAGESTETWWPGTPGARRRGRR